ncbi:cysteine hydrolase family protein [Alienimonas chondri]|uniref:Peroxyureidoacrylate/ureidoacrylate amidohydrolase RutB n=1 Tax=Alienimonas chondri TaxID=2681879 RepID=A0ABX1VA80_9PLAN|nr:isochorismatase family cysteine hydrolase [Alienimonas chondri]NNJ24959.1 Peroxyureidoacrylate/ureidoacrylate amidohydrolase RutB [Alienimonas chondri]
MNAPPPTGPSSDEPSSDEPLSEDSHAGERCRVALLLIDFVNDLDFPDGEELRPHAEAAAKNAAALKRQARAAGVPIVYVNDNFGRWRSDFSATLAHATRDGSRGKRLTETIAPDDDDYFVLKPRHSGFYRTVLEELLGDLGADTLVLCGLAGNICVQMTAHDALLRNYRVIVPRDAVASNRPELNAAALEQMRLVCKADVPAAAEVDFESLKHDRREACS